MPGATYSNPAGRINRIKGEILAHAVPIECLGITGAQKQMPKNQGDTIVYRRYLPYGALATNFSTKNRPSATVAAHVLQEGVTPAADSLTPDDITVQIQQFGVLYQLTDKTADLHEDDIPGEMKRQVGERISLVREMIRYGVLKAGANIYYSGGTSRATVNSKITETFMQKMARNLAANHAKRITSILAPSPDFNTAPVEAAYLVFAHTDCEQDIRKLTGFKHVSEYGQRKVIHEQELGSWESFRFIVSPELAPVPDSGAAVGATGLYSTTGANVDIYPIVVAGQDGWGQLALRGADSLDPTYIPPGQKTKDDPLGQRGYVGSKFWMQAMRLNDGWMAVGEVGVTALV